MHRAIRLVVDVGLHTKGWTREQAIQYSLEKEPYSEREIIAEIERYMAFPGQSLGYKIGQIKIMELRSKAEKELKNKFDNPGISQYNTEIGLCATFYSGRDKMTGRSKKIPDYLNQRTKRPLTLCICQPVSLEKNCLPK